MPLDQTIYIYRHCQLSDRSHISIVGNQQSLIDCSRSGIIINNYTKTHNASTQYLEGFEVRFSHKHDKF